MIKKLRVFLNKIYKVLHKTIEPILEAEIKDNIAGSLEELYRLKEYVNLILCPCCGQSKRLLIIEYKRGNLEWEAKIQCASCSSKGILNQSGLHMNLAYKGIVNLNEQQPIVSRKVS